MITDLVLAVTCHRYVDFEINCRTVSGNCNKLKTFILSVRTYATKKTNHESPEMYSTALLYCVVYHCIVKLHRGQSGNQDGAVTHDLHPIFLVILHFYCFREHFYIYNVLFHNHYHDFHYSYACL